MSKQRHVNWKDLNFERNDNRELTEIIDFDSTNIMSDDESLIINETHYGVNDEPKELLTSLRSGLAVNESINRENHPELEERISEVDDLIFRLEDMAAMLRTQLHSAREALHQTKKDKKPKNLPFVIKYELLFVILFQAITLICTAIYDHFWKGGPFVYEALIDIISTTFFVGNALIVGTATAILSRKMLKNNADSILMAQTYFSTVIVFSSLYYIVFRFEPDSWEFSETDHIKDTVAFDQYVRMLYLSVSSATLCGAANIQPRAWYVTLMVCFQSLVNFVYFASILAQTIGNYNSYTVQVQRSRSVTASMSVTSPVTYSQNDRRKSVR